MQIELIEELINDPEKLRDGLTAEKGSIDFKTYSDQYGIKEHAVMKRQMKIVNTNNGTESIDVAKIPLSLQKTIVNRAASFLCGNEVENSANPASDQQTNMLAVINKILLDNKSKYKNFEIAKRLFSETEVAEIWFPEPLESESKYWLGTPLEKASVKFRQKIISYSTGDTLLPSFDDTGEMNAFVRMYQVSVGSEKVDQMEIYTAQKIVKMRKSQNGWEMIESGANAFQKIPVIYYRQDQPDWFDVQNAIDRLEMSVSRHGDTNDYFGSPTVKLQGNVKGFAKKGEDGKVLQLENGATAEYLTWDHSPESVKLEQENLRSYIFDLTDTPDISFTQMSKLGTFSGFAIKLLFMAAHMKAAEKEQIVGEGFQRRLNLLKQAIATLEPNLKEGLSLNVVPKFTYYLPVDEQAEIDLLGSATQFGILSKKTAIAKNPLVIDPIEEEKRIIAEKETNNSNPNELDNEFM